MSKQQRNSVYLIAKILRPYGLVDDSGLDKIVKNAGSSVRDIERALSEGQALPPPGVSFKFLAQQIDAAIRGISAPVSDLPSLLVTLSKTKRGKATAIKYQEIITEIIRLLFVKRVGSIQAEQTIFSGIKRLDIKADNDRKNGFFINLRTQYEFYCPYIFFECKNYTRDPKNPELDQLLGRLNSTSTMVGFMICRELKNENLVCRRCKDAYLRDKKLMLWLTDHDIANLSKSFLENGSASTDSFLKKRLEKVVLE